MFERSEFNPKRFEPDGEDESIDADELLRRAQSAAGRTTHIAARVFPALLALGVVVWLGSGVYMVNPGQQGVVRHFGSEIGKTAPGLHYHFPWPIQEVDIVDVQAIRRLEVGFRTQNGKPQRVPAEALMLTGDENIVDLQFTVQYRVREPSQYLYRLRDPEQTLHAASQVAIRSIVGNQNIDDVLTVGRAEAQQQAQTYLQQLMDEYQSGLLITEVKLQVVDPPEQVKDAFNEVVRAREDRERQQNEAEAYREDILPKARGEAQQMIRAAEAYREERVLQAQGDVAKFAAVLEEYRKGRDVTRERLYLETVERVLGGVGKTVIDRSVGDRTLPFLPLGEAVQGTAPLPPQPPAVNPAPPAPAGQGQQAPAARPAR